MRLIGKKVLAMVLSLVIALGVLGATIDIKVYAISPKTGNFNKSYSLTGNGATDIVNVAVAQNGKTGSSFGYGDEWCSAFVSDCASLAGQGSVVPWNGNQENLRSAVMNAGGSQIYKMTGSYSATGFTNAKVGDLVFINWGNSNAATSSHVEIVWKAEGGKIYTVGGNTGDGNSYNTRVVTQRTRNTQNAYEKTVWVVRPNYGGSSGGTTPSQPTQLFTTSGITLPSGKITQGNDFSVSGMVYCTKSISWINLAVVNLSTGATILEPGKHPQTTSFNIADFNSAINFGTLSPGNYRAILKAGCGENGDEYMQNIKSDFEIVSSDTTPPSISNAVITDMNREGFTVMCMVSDNVEVTSVKFPTWTPWQGDNNGQDDIKWYEGTIFGDVAYAEVKFSEHNNEKGAYVTHIYAYDAAGNNSVASIGITVEENGPVISSVEVTNVSPSGYTVSCKVTDDTAVDYVKFPTWSAQTGANATDRDDITWGTGTKNGNTYSYTVKISEHKNERGRYKTYIYAYDVWGNNYVYPIENIYVPSSSEYYTVTYDANGGKGAPSSNSAYVEVKLSNTKPTREGYEFLGWAKSSTATTAQYQPGETIQPGKSLTLYAVWKQIPVTTYTLTYNSNSGSGAPASQTGNGSITLSGSKPTRNGYTFINWNTKADGTGTSYNPGATYSLTANVTLYAIWEQNPVTPTTYTLIYNANGGENPPASQSGNGNIALSSVKPTKDGYTFLNWNTKADGTGTSYYSGETYNLTANVTLYAIWEQNPVVITTYTLTYNANGGENPPADQTGDGNITLSNDKPTRDGYTFKNWNIKADGTGTSYNPGAAYSLTADATLFAVWEKNPVVSTTYTLIYDANGGKNPPATQTDSGNITLSSVKPTRDGYTFLIWNTKADGTGISYNPGTAYNLTADAILYAIWEQNSVAPTTYTLKYNANGGKNPPANQTGNGNITISGTNTTRDGYTFKNWNTKPDGSGTNYNPGEVYNLTANTTLYAIWQKNETHDNPTPVQPAIQIRNYVPTLNVSYRATVKLKAEFSNAPEGATVHWFLDGVDRMTDNECILKEFTGTHTIQAKLISTDGEVLAESELETISANTGFFARLIAFFRALFGLLPVIEQ